MSQPIGYSVETDDNNLETAGELYNYTWAGNGVFLDAMNPLLAARIPVARGVTRGLLNLEPAITLAHGNLDQRYFDYVLAEMLETPDKECYYAITWEDDRYKIRKPDLHQTEGSVKYEVLSNVVMELHSHPGNQGIWFSSQDNSDEQGLKIYGVVGCLGRPVPLAFLRVGVYGNFYYLDPSEVFMTVPTRAKFEKEPFNVEHALYETISDYWSHLGKED